jgi:TPP-dependent pyruvate/acetoin dehydrogenase alpha subunit
MDQLAIWKQTCRNRYFELEVAKAIELKILKGPFYLSIGQEHVPAVVSQICTVPEWQVFPQHRCHSWYLSYTQDYEGLAKELLGRSDGCNKGMGGSASVSSKKHNFYGHSGLLGDQVPIATGAAHASGKKTICVLGDAAAEEDYTLGALGYAATKKAPILYLVEDNDLSILTRKSVRRSWDIADVAKAMGLTVIHDASDYPTDIFDNIEYLVNDKLPALINIQVERHRWHAGAGMDGPPQWDTFAEMIDELTGCHATETVMSIQYDAKEEMEELWKRLL